MRNMHVVEKSKSARPLTDDEIGDEFIRADLLRRLDVAVTVIREEVPRRAWPRVVARLEAAGLLPPMSDDDLAEHA
jgi:hypothetical protein